MEQRAKTRLITLQILWTALSLVSVLFPVFFIFAFIPLIILTAHFFVKGIWQNAAVLALILAGACVISGSDFIVILFTVLTDLGVLGAVAGLKLRSYLSGAAVSALILIAAAVILPVSMCAALQKKPADFLHDYVGENLEKESQIFLPPSQIKLAAHIYYLFYTPEEGEKAARADEGYNAAVKEAFLIKAWDAGENEFFYTLMGMGAVAGIFSYICVLLLNKEKAVKPPPAFKNMRLDRNFFLIVFLPVFAFSFLGYIAPLKQIAAAVFFSFAAVPAAFSAFTLLAHTLGRIKQLAARRTGYILLGMLGLVCAVWPSALISVSFLGAADSILNVRRLLDFSLDEGEFKK